MSAATQLWLWIAFIGMVLGSIVFGLKAAGQRHREGMEFSMVSFFITLWAASVYLSMILCETVLFNFNGQQDVFWGRYLDWIITTPLLLLDLGVISGIRPKLIMGVIGADVFMIVTGFVATLAAAPINYLWYVISCGAFLAIIASLFTEFSATARRRSPKVNSLFQKLRNILVVLWIAYPIVWILGAEGLRVIDVGVETACYAILDLCAKVGFGFVLVSAGQDVLAQASSGDRRQDAAESYLNEPSSRY
ncbi:MAG TPA: bacteriorhodopsin [Leptolyngbya sp.]|jgi:bacteriorhodopsin|nr:bacteriorhodopsin [Leptolyngbya sp.]